MVPALCLVIGWVVEMPNVCLMWNTVLQALWWEGIMEWIVRGRGSCGGDNLYLKQGNLKLLGCKIKSQCLNFFYSTHCCFINLSLNKSVSNLSMYWAVGQGLRLFNGWDNWGIDNLNYLLLSMHEFCGRLRNKAQMSRNKFQLQHIHL